MAGSVNLLFLDIDGVLNSRRSALAFDGYPLVFKRGLPQFDQVAIRMVRRLVRATKSKVVLSSSWRMDEQQWSLAAKSLRLPIIDRTPHDLGSVPRGQEIQHWLDTHPHPDRQYVILDDDLDMLPEQFERFVHVDYRNGLSFQDLERACTLFGISVHDLYL